MKQWPAAVHVFLPLEDDMLESGEVRIEALAHVVWAELYPTEKEAKRRDPWGWRQRLWRWPRRGGSSKVFCDWHVYEDIKK